MTVLRREDAPVTRHQRSNEFPKRLAVPAPSLTREALDVRLLSPQAELHQPPDDWALPYWPLEIGGEALLYIEPAYSCPRTDVVRNSPLGDVAAWKFGRDDRFEVVNNDRVDIGE